MNHPKVIALFIFQVFSTLPFGTHTLYEVLASAWNLRKLLSLAHVICQYVKLHQIRHVQKCRISPSFFFFWLFSFKSGLFFEVWEFTFPFSLIFFCAFLIFKNIEHASQQNWTVQIWAPTHILIDISHVYFNIRGSLFSHNDKF